jgi:steroid delta-isomerase-like uncharacterized protein
MIRITVILLTIVFLNGFIGCQSTNEKEIKSEKMFREYFESWNTHDVEKMASFFTEDCVYDNLARGQTYRGKDELKSWAKASFDVIPDFKIDITSLFISVDLVACEWVMTGTLSGNSPELPATGKSFSVRGATIAQLKDGKIQRNADYWDLATFLRQVGLME